MFRSRGNVLTRTFHTYPGIQGSSLREKLKSVQQRNVLLNKSSKELARLDAKKRLQLKNLQKKAYPRQQAFHLLKRQNADLDEDLKAAAVGPTSEADLKYLMHTKDKRMIYTILGINGEQLRDSKLVAEDVKKFLRRGQVEKAVFLTRLAKRKGSAGMNAIMDYYFREQQAPRSGIDMFNWRKKWGIPPNEFTNTILFDGLARQKKNVSKASADLVTRTVNRLIEQDECSQIEYNAALSALSNCTDVTPAFELYEKKIKGISKDVITYLWMLRATKRADSDTIFQELALNLLKSIPPKFVDAQLLFEFCKTLHSRTSNGKLQSTTVLALKEYFEIDLDSESLPKPITDFKIVPLSHWSIDQRYPLSMPVIGLLLDNCLQTGQYELGIQSFLKLKVDKKEMLDLDMYHKYMELLSKGHGSECGDQCLEVFREMEKNPKLISAKHSLVLVYKAFERQAGKKVNNSDQAKIDRLLEKCLRFIGETEGVYSKEFKARLYPAKAWQFLLSIVKAANTCGAISTRVLTVIIDSYLKSVIHGEFDSEKGSPLPTRKFVELECVRLLNGLASRMALPDIEDVDLSLPSVERNIFLQRRRLLQFRNCLLRNVEALETAKPETAVLEQSESILKDRAPQIISDHATHEYNRYVLKSVKSF